ncbi:MAG: OB-fold nucleic acid binding domain-containing protein, partial [Chloroflexota bacterium]|nr:OB-fold nucleic acid binding domain-containing protein [Chloroflexota bacterium]
EVLRIFSPYEGLTLITVHDDSGEIVVAADETLIALTGPLPEIAEGQGIVATGTVTLYRDTPQLAPATVRDIALSAAPPPEELTVVEPCALSALSASDEGSWVNARGRIVALEGFKGGLKATLDDGTAQVLLVLWQSLYAELPEPTALDVGAEVEVAGEVKVYQGDLELVPGSPGDVRIVTAAPEIPWVEVQALSTADTGRIVRLRGVSGDPVAFSAGVKVPLDDGTGTITVLLWSNVAEALAQPPQAGMLLEVVGEVAFYQDEMELIPRSPYDWRPEP